MKNRLLVLTLLFFAASGFISWASRPEIVPIRESLSGFPMTVGSWEGRQLPEMNSTIRAALGVEDYVNRIYYNSEFLPASLYIGYYESQREGDTIHSPLNCLPGAGWNPAQKARIAIQTASSSGSHRQIVINRLVIVKGTEKQLVLYWYQSHGRVIASEYWGKIYTVLDALRTNRTDAALIRVIVPIFGSSFKDEMAAEQRGTGFVQSLFSSLERFLPA